MATDTKAVSTALSSSPEQKTLVGMINGSISELAKALPKHLSPERMARIATTCIRQNPRLAQCTPASFMGSLFVCAQIGLEPVAGLAHLVPFSNSKKINGVWVKVLECQLIIGYKGIAELFYRHEKSGLIDWGTVHEKDEFSYELGTNAYLKHKPAARERGKVIGHYCIYTLLNGLKKFNYMTHDECMEHGRKHSKTFDGAAFNSKSPWATNADSMCLKTVMLQGSKTVPMSTELRRALDTDETSREFKDGITDALDLPVNNWQEAEAETKEIKADTSKVAGAISGPEPTPEELEAIAARAKVRLHEGQEQPKSEPAKPQAPVEGSKTVTGCITYAGKPNAGGYRGFSMEGQQNEDGKDVMFATRDTATIDEMLGYIQTGETVSVQYTETVNGKYTNYNIVSVEVGK